MENAEHIALMPDQVQDYVRTARPLIVTGMPLSGGSIVAQALAEAGLYLGDAAPISDAFAASGVLADEDMVRFHKDLLAVNRADWTDVETLPGLTVSRDYEAQGRALLARKFSEPIPWGWHDPRTTLFLDYWDALLPQAQWIFVVRRPAHVAWSMLSRGILDDAADTPVGRAMLALRLWTHYNRRILTFVQKTPDRSMLFFIPGDLSNGIEAYMNERLTERSSWALRPVTIEDVFNPHLLKKASPRWVSALATLYRPGRLVLRQLAQHRGPTPRPGGTDRAQGTIGVNGSYPTPEASTPTIGLLSRHHFAYSETFVRDHVRKLPAPVTWIHGRDIKRTADHLPVLTPLERVLYGTLKEFRVNTDALRARALRRYLRKGNVQAVLAEFGPVGADAVAACRSARIPLVVHFHGYDAYKRPILERYERAYQEIFEEAAALVAVSRDMVDQLVSLGAPREKITWNPCGVDTAFFCGADPSQAPPVFVATGRFVGKKAPHYTLLAFREVAQACPEARLIMIGDGFLREACIQLAGALGIAEKVTFAGFRPHPEVAAAMRSARAFVQHSVRGEHGDSEGTPVGILEAGSSGLPVVSTAHAGIKDVVVHEETGFLVEEGDVEAMAGYMLALAQQPDLAAAMGRRARERVCGHFSMEQSIDRLWRVLEKAIHASAHDR